MTKRILFLNENPLDAVFTTGTIAGKELRLRAAIHEIDEVHVITLPGKSVSFYSDAITELERKIIVHTTIPWPHNLSTVILFLYGWYYAWKLKPFTIEAESPLFSGPAAVLIGQMLRIPSIIEVRASYEHIAKFRFSWIPLSWKVTVIQAVMDYCYSRAAALIVNSQTYKNLLTTKGHVSTEINPGVQYLSHKDTKKGKVIGYLGRLAPEKGILVLLGAVTVIQQTLREEGWSIAVVGDGVLFQAIQKFITEKQIQDLVTLHGFQPNQSSLETFTILVNPCLVFAPLEMANAEAAYMGVPVISFGTDSIPETVAHMKSGIVVKTHRADALAEALLIYIRDEALRDQHAKNAKSFALKHYNFEAQVNKLRQLYRRTISHL